LLAKFPVDIRVGSLFGLTMFILAPFVVFGFALCRLAIYMAIPLISFMPYVILTLHRNFNLSNWQIVLVILTHIVLNLVFLLALMGVIGIHWTGILAILGATAQVTLVRFAKAERL
jgi:hypothetical protein